MRKSDYYRVHLGEPSDRTRELVRLKVQYAEALEWLHPGLFPPELVAEAIDLLSTESKPKEKKKKGEQAVEAPKNDASKQAVAPWSVPEVGKICELLVQARREGLKEKELEKLIQGASRALRETLVQNAFDIALSGRMVTSGLMQPIDGAMAVAHAVTTHAVDADIDWFTAVDDLVVDASETGAGHLNTQEFSAGVFYRYASLNLGLLSENVGEVSRSVALEKAAHLMHLLATVVPTAKQNSFAAHNLADLVLVSFSDFPMSLANAFESPVKAGSRGGFIMPSIQALESYLHRVYAGYGLKDRRAAFTLWETKLEPRLETMEQLGQWVCNDAQTNGATP